MSAGMAEGCRLLASPIAAAKAGCEWGTVLWSHEQDSAKKAMKDRDSGPQGTGKGW